MSTLLYLGKTPAHDNSDSKDTIGSAIDAESVRSTTNTIEPDAPSAMQEHTPEWNETFTDPDTEGGLTSRQESSNVSPTVKGNPFVGKGSQDEYNAIINRQVSSAGIAPAKEARGEWGHGTLKIVTGIEPTIVDGQQLGSDYFVTNPRPLAGSANYMTPAATSDAKSNSDAQASATRAARKAANASMYAAFYAVQTGERTD